MEVFNPGISVTTYPLLTSSNTQTKQGNELHLFVAYRLEFLRNGPDKNDSNNGKNMLECKKRANFSIVYTYF